MQTGDDQARPQQPEPDRVRLAANTATPPDVLMRLAQDPAVTVRAAVAMNAQHVPAVQARLRHDPDERVRALLGTRLASLLPGLSGPSSAAAQMHVHETLLALADDAVTLVRAAITDAVKDMPCAPRAVILRLANDPVATVSDPVLRLSPTLTDMDLLDLLATPAHHGTAAAIASRRGLGMDVTDHIAAQADGVAVRTLLENGSAMIREATLDALASRAGDYPDWHEPLARRPALSPRTLRRLSTMVAGHLLSLLAARPDIPPDIADELGLRLQDTLTPGARSAADRDLMEEMRRLAQAGQLSEARMLEAVGQGAFRQAAAILALFSGTTLATIDRTIALRSAKALTSLAWKAGFSMRAAEILQSAIGQLQPGERLLAGPGGVYPLTADEMDWQIELLAEPSQ